MMKYLYFHNYTMTPAIVTQVVHKEDGVILKKLNISESGLYNPVTGLLKIGRLYPTPWGKLPINKIENGSLIF